MIRKTKIFKIIYYLVIAFIAFVAVLLIVSVLPITGNIKFFVVQSGSMEPAIKMGSVVMIKPEKDYKVGDIITFGRYTRTKAPTTHRIYKIENQGPEPLYITKGDANNAPDFKKIRKSEILGKVILSIPYVGYAVDFAKKPVGFALIIIIPAGVIIGDEIKKIYVEIKKKKTK